MLMTMLRSIKEFYGYSVYAMDSNIGKIREFYLNDKEWLFSCIAVNTGGCLRGRDIYLSPKVFEEVDSKQKHFFIQQSIEELQKDLYPTCVSEMDPSLKPASGLFGLLVYA